MRSGTFFQKSEAIVMSERKKVICCHVNATSPYLRCLQINRLAS